MPLSVKLISSLHNLPYYLSVLCNPYRIFYQLNRFHYIINQYLAWSTDQSTDQWGIIFKPIALNKVIVETRINCNTPDTRFLKKICINDIWIIHYLFLKLMIFKDTQYRTILQTVLRYKFIPFWEIFFFLNNSIMFI